MNRNITHALIRVLSRIDDEGQVIVARGQEQREILSSLTKIARPQERFLVLPGRNNNVFAQLAETAWVLAGRNDLAFLSHYLPRAADFSDDGHTWRAAYGPRIRRWGGRVDQVQEVVRRLKEDPNTKRAVISLFDPSCDFTETKDVPCNNWLQFIHRNGILDIHVTVRANDAIWGFSGINFFEWSVLQEIVASSLGWRVGMMSWYVGTFHIYTRHYPVAERLRTIDNPKSIYEFGIPVTRILTTVDSLDETLSLFFDAETCARQGALREAAILCQRIDDPFFWGAATMLLLYNAHLIDMPWPMIEGVLCELGDSDFFAAAVEFLSRKNRWHPPITMTSERQMDFIAHCNGIRDRQLVDA